MKWCEFFHSYKCRKWYSFSSLFAVLWCILTVLLVLLHLLQNFVKIAEGYKIAVLLVIFESLEKSILHIWLFAFNHLSSSVIFLWKGNFKCPDWYTPSQIHVCEIWNLLHFPGATHVMTTKSFQNYKKVKQLPFQRLGR